MCGAQKPSTTTPYEQHQKATADYEARIDAALEAIRLVVRALECAILVYDLSLARFHATESKEDKKRLGIILRQSGARQETAQGRLRHLFARGHIYQQAFTAEDYDLAFRHKVPEIFILDFYQSSSESSSEAGTDDSGEDSDW